MLIQCGILAIRCLGTTPILQERGGAGVLWEGEFCLSGTPHTTDTCFLSSSFEGACTARLWLEDFNPELCAPGDPFIPRSHGQGVHGWAVWAVQPAVNNHNQRAYSPAILIGDNSTDPRAFLIEQAGPGGEGVVTIHWDNSSRPNIVLASEVILLTVETHPPDNIPPGVALERASLTLKTSWLTAATSAPRNRVLRPRTSLGILKPRLRCSTTLPWLPCPKMNLKRPPTMRGGDAQGLLLTIP